MNLKKLFLKSRGDHSKPDIDFPQDSFAFFFFGYASWFVRSQFPDPSGSDGKETTYNSGDSGPIPESGSLPGGGNGNLLQYSCLENAMDREV